VDNTFATPYCQRPLEHGADLVVHSLTKNICGFGTDIGGVVIGGKEFLPSLLMYRKYFGGVMSPKAAWPILVYGLPTLPLRTSMQMKNAMEIARFLENHPKVERVQYPGLPSFRFYNLAKKQMIDYDGNFAPGILLYFVLKGTPDEALKRGRKMIDFIAEHAYTLTMAVSLGQIRTLIENPASMTHSAIPADEQVKAGIDPGGIRLAIGIEEVKDIINDLGLALDQI
jgi:cystathionine beta-lyase/cystathionine gamma-synthase